MSRRTRVRACPTRPARRTVAALATCAVLASAAPAWGHASLDQASVPKSSESVLNVRVPVEPREHGGADPDLNQRYNVKVSVEIPDGFVAVACEGKAGWACEVKPKAGRAPHHVAYTRTGGPNDAEDIFAMTVNTPERTGEYKFEINQTYSDDEVVQWSGDKDSPTPASFVRVQ